MASAQAVAICQAFEASRPVFLMAPWALDGAYHLLQRLRGPSPSEHAHAILRHLSSMRRVGVWRPALDSAISSSLNRGRPAAKGTYSLVLSRHSAY